jgi:hypothetical protein
MLTEFVNPSGSHRTGLYAFVHVEYPEENQLLEDFSVTCSVDKEPCEKHDITRVVSRRGPRHIQYVARRIGIDGSAAPLSSLRTEVTSKSTNHPFSGTPTFPVK